ncbi:unnamed protein product [Chrysodeixis includens]|uniref:Uncharacterized protein n=1 Tax=Chrysodeixis includens TaxID=689277 RepID=A0A9P0E6H9_CHRIL|nr:unnamed protein product [Chrysodeixis includens]
MFISFFPEFAEVQCRPNDELSKCCDTLFDILQDSFSDNKKSRVAMWPLQIMLLVLNPRPIVTMCQLRASTYLNVSTRNVTFILVKSVINDLKSLLFNPSKSYIRGSVISGYSELDLMTDCFVSLFRIMPHNNDALKVCLNLNTHISYHYVIVNSLLSVISGYSELDLMTDCFVSLFRIMPHNNDALKVCLNLNTHISYHYVIVNSLLRIIKQPRVCRETSRSSCYIPGLVVHTPLRMISLSLKSKEVQSKFNKSEEMLLQEHHTALHEPWLPSSIEIQSSTTELMNGPRLARPPDRMRASIPGRDGRSTSLHNRTGCTCGTQSSALLNTFWDIRRLLALWGQEVLLRCGKVLTQHWDGIPQLPTIGGI